MAAGMRVTDSTSADRLVTAFKMIDAGSVDRTITVGRIIGPDGVDRVFYDTAGTSSFAASASPASVNGHGNGSATTANVTITPTGGTAPYFHAWTLISHSNATNPTIGSAAAATTSFTQTNIGAGEVDTATFRDTITDSAGNSTTVNVNTTFFDTSLL
jgi:hypothetical protein